MCWKKKEKIYIFYTVCKKDNQNIWLTVTSNETDAFEYIFTMLKLDNSTHYKSWCNLHNLDEKSDEAWTKYYNLVIDNEQKQSFIVRKIYYKANDLAAILRMFGGCPPVGCKFDTAVEYNYLKHQIQKEEELSKLKSYIDNLIEQDIDKDTDNGK